MSGGIKADHSQPDATSSCQPEGIIRQLGFILLFVPFAFPPFLIHFFFCLSSETLNGVYYSAVTLALLGL